MLCIYRLALRPATQPFPIKQQSIFVRGSSCVQAGTLIRVCASRCGSLFRCLLMGSTDLQIISPLLTLNSQDGSGSRQKHPKNVELDINVYHWCFRHKPLQEVGLFLRTDGWDLAHGLDLQTPALLVLQVYFPLLGGEDLFFTSFAWGFYLFI